MPELPEVETVRRGLEKAMRGRAIARVELRRAGLRAPFPPGLGALRGREILALSRRGKYLLAALGGGKTLIVHLGMSGRITVARSPARQKHDHMVLTLDDGTTVTLNDPRRFGLVDLADTAAVDAHPLFARLGPEPLGPGFTPTRFAAALAGRKTAIKAAVMDQRIVAGVGNIYASEALHMARIHPARAAGSLTKTEAARLARAVRRTLEKAIAAGGSSLRDYVRADGSLGYFQHQWAVYGKEGAPCPRRGCKGTVRKTVQAARASFYCPRCQKRV